MLSEMSYEKEICELRFHQKKLIKKLLDVSYDELPRLLISISRLTTIIAKLEKLNFYKEKHVKQFEKEVNKSETQFTEKKQNSDDQKINPRSKIKQENSDKLSTLLNDIHQKLKSILPKKQNTHFSDNLIKNEKYKLKKEDNTSLP